MRRRFVGMLIMALSFGYMASAQEEDTFTDEELTTYATVMKWAEVEKDSMGSRYNGWIQNDEAISSAKFSELRKAEKEGALETAEATEEELAAFQNIQTKYSDMTGAFKETYTTKIKEDIGAGLYNRLRKALKADEELNTRYEAIYEAIVLPAAEETQTEGTADAGGN